ncbi:hypothetical protein ONZ43_g3888 [Nemania bipapillata]|uniref:Uncharacterized protein n=1 Tax=Nemania bipapillata TaxID=110536 RepID=A0ACC2IV81_9PEZI|nr:hypothetical protein ONZ43_g3888 [Nemania bipapillata]
MIVAVMGMTGVGKSTFISRLCEERIKIGHDFESCTQSVDVYTWKSPMGLIYLIDTPGFDDDVRSDGDVLSLIAEWLLKTYKRKIHLSGILYLHRISDNRMSGNALRNLKMFQNLCGQTALPNVILATTMWEKVSEAEGVRLETLLKNKEQYWGVSCPDNF